MTTTTAPRTTRPADRFRSGARRTVAALDTWTLTAFNPPVARAPRTRPATRES